MQGLSDLTTNKINDSENLKMLMLTNEQAVSAQITNNELQF